MRPPFGSDRFAAGEMSADESGAKPVDAAYRLRSSPDDDVYVTSASLKSPRNITDAGNSINGQSIAYVLFSR